MIATCHLKAYAARMQTGSVADNRAIADDAVEILAFYANTTASAVASKGVIGDEAGINP